MTEAQGVELIAAVVVVGQLLGQLVAGVHFGLGVALGVITWRCCGFNFSARLMARSDIP